MNPHKISKYIPEFLRTVVELAAIYAEDDYQLDKIGLAKIKALRNQFIAETDETGIKRYEQMFGIVPPSTDTLEDRRFRLETLIRDRRPYTETTLYTILTELCGASNVNIDIDVEEYMAYIKLTAATRSQYLSAQQLIERILPCNLGRTFQLVFERSGAMYIGGAPEQLRTIVFPVCSAIMTRELRGTTTTGGAVHQFKRVCLEEG